MSGLRILKSKMTFNSYFSIELNEIKIVLGQNGGARVFFRSFHEAGSIGVWRWKCMDVIGGLVGDQAHSDFKLDGSCPEREKISLCKLLPLLENRGSVLRGTGIISDTRIVIHTPLGVELSVRCRSQPELASGADRSMVLCKRVSRDYGVRYCHKQWQRASVISARFVSVSAKSLLRSSGPQFAKYAKR